ncbi:uncharacterized protein LOC135831691 [Planococcus citri]|uniref:uncharacterized protein LOC135831691 n=1 Tax=Planococcus citri TaxID=170843 RepID=UPI0031F73D21
MYQEVANEETGSGVHNCVACGRRGRVGFYSVPKDTANRTLWLERCGLDRASPIAPNARICKFHFKDEDFSIQRRLKRKAVPSIVVPADTSKYQRCQRTKKCFVCGTLNTECHSFHRIPFDESIRKEWFQNLGIKTYDFEIIPKDIRLCEIHFRESDFIVHPQTKSRRLKRGCKPRITASSLNLQNNRSKLPEINNDEDSDSSVMFVSAFHQNITPVIELDDDDEEEEEHAMSCKKSYSEDVPADEIAPNQSNITIDLTETEDVGNKYIRRLEKNEQLKRQRQTYQALLDDLIENKFVIKKGKKLIKKFRRNLEDPAAE